MTTLKNIIASTVANVVMDQTKNISNVLPPCDIRDCEYSSTGVQCVDCGRIACNNHMYFKMQGVSIVPKCIYCVIDENPDMFEDDE